VNNVLTHEQPAPGQTPMAPGHPSPGTGNRLTFSGNIIVETGTGPTPYPGRPGDAGRGVADCGAGELLLRVPDRGVAVA
jgi:hypothetical protein